MPAQTPLPHRMPVQALALPEDTARIAEASGRTLARLLETLPAPEGLVHLCVERADGSRADVDVPPAALAQFASLLQEMGRTDRERGLDELVTEAQALGLY